MNFLIAPDTFSDNDGGIYCMDHAPAELRDAFDDDTADDVYDMPDGTWYERVSAGDISLFIEPTRKGGIAVNLWLPKCQQCTLLGI